MRKFFYSLIFVLPSITFADNLPEIPAIYIDPSLSETLFENPKIVQNGYVVVGTIEQAKTFFDHLPPDVDFDKQEVILFAWAGSGKDVIDYDRDGDVYHFVYKPGMTRDYRQHVKMFVMERKYDWLFHRVLQ